MIFVYLIISIVLIGLDQLFKFLAASNLQIQSLPLIDNVLYLTYTENTGAAFSIFNRHTWILALITGVLLVALLIFVFVKKIKSHYLLIDFALVFAGGVGNLIDRIFRGYVVDFIYFKPINFPVFNFADICVFCGAVMFIVYLLFIEPRQIKQKQINKDASSELDKKEDDFE